MTQRRSHSINTIVRHSVLSLVLCIAGPNVASTQGASGFVPGPVGYQQPLNATNAQNANNASLAATAQHLDSTATVQTNQIQGSRMCDPGQVLTSISTCTNSIANADSATTSNFASSSGTASSANSASTANYANSAGSASYASGAGALQGPSCSGGSAVFPAGTQTSFQLPFGCYSFSAKLWGAGGGGGNQWIGGGNGGYGGGGGYTSGSVSGLKAWTTLFVTVGVGGQGNSNQNGGWAGGGGYSGIFFNQTSLFIAGGGGGGGAAINIDAWGGAGGGLNGQSGDGNASLVGGGGGSQSSGGSAGNGLTSPNSGAYLTGGTTPTSPTGHNFSFGGAGYYGGGPSARGAGGGSGYVAPSGTYDLSVSGSTQTGNYFTQANNGDPQNNGAGAGGVQGLGGTTPGPASSGAGGLIIISWP